MRGAGVLVAGAVVLVLIGLAVWAVRRAGGVAGRGGKPVLTDTQVLLLATTSAIAVPFLLPSMHERYFYVADVLSVIVAFQRPRQLWYVPVLVQLSSLGSYLKFIAPDVSPYLSMPAHGVLMLLALLAVLRATAGSSAPSRRRVSPPPRGSWSTADPRSLPRDGGRHGRPCTSGDRPVSGRDDAGPGSRRPQRHRLPIRLTALADGAGPPDVGRALIVPPKGRVLLWTCAGSLRSGADLG